jgi:hypothetical protein
MSEKSQPISVSSSPGAIRSAMDFAKRALTRDSFPQFGILNANVIVHCQKENEVSNDSLNQALNKLVLRF